MKHGSKIPRSPDAFHKWCDEHRSLVWDIIERLGKGKVSHKEARQILRGEMKVLNAFSKQVFGFKCTQSASKPRTSGGCSKAVSRLAKNHCLNPKRRTVCPD